jgi:hypothetical protein
VPTYPTDFVTMRQALFDWVSTDLGAPASGWRVMIANQPGDALRAPALPAKPFAKIEFLELPQAEGRQFAQSNNAGPTQLDVYVRNVGLMRVEVQLYADTDERVRAESLRASVDLLYPTIDLLKAAGLTIVPSEVRARDLSAIFAGQNEFRYALEIGLRVETRRVVTNYPWIETVQPLTVAVN